MYQLKPFKPVIDRQIPDLVSGYLFNEGTGNSTENFVTGDLATVGGTNVFWTVNDQGPAVAFKPGSSNYFMSLGPADALFGVEGSTDPVKNLTIVIGYKKTEGTALKDAWIFGPRIDTTAGSTVLDSMLHAQCPNRQGRFTFNVGGTSIVSSANQKLGNDVMVYVLSSARGMEIWQNGSLVVSSPTVGEWLPTTANFVLGDADPATSGAIGGDAGENSFFYIFKRAFDIDEIRQISAQPFTMFPKRRLYIPAIHELGSGGVTAGASAKALVTCDKIPSGGVEISGTSLMNVLTLISGGAVVTGSADVTSIETRPANGGVTVGSSGDEQVIYEPDMEFGGVTIGGSTPNVMIHVGSGGVTIGGTVALTGTGQPVISGGVVCGSSATCTSFTGVILSSNVSVRVGGRSIVVRKGITRTIRTGIGRALKSQNILKTAEEDKLKRNKVALYINTVTPELPPGFRIQHNPSWYEIGEPTVENGAALAANVKRLQGKYLPPKNQGNTVRDRTVARLT